MVHLPRGPIRPLTRRHYERLVESGAFDGERVEFIHGFLVEMSPIGARHAYAVRRLDRLLQNAVRDRAEVSVQSPLVVADHSEPQPDLAVVPPASVATSHPSRAFLVIEVADTSLDYDRTEKAALYATADVAEYWIVNLLDDVVEINRDADPRGSWRNRVTVGRGGTVSPVAFPDVVLSVDDFMPAR